MIRHDVNHIAVLDVGTSKIACFIAELDDAWNLRVKGIGHQLSQGIRAGMVTDMQAAEASIIAAVHAAEQMAGITIDRVYVGLSGGSPRSHRIDVEVPLSNQAISERDMQRVLALGKRSIVDPERAVIHCIPVSYNIDEATGVQDPRGLYGRRLGACVHAVSVSSSALRNLSHCIGRCHLDICGVVMASHASGLAVLTEDERNLGVTVVDIGGSSTSVAVFVEGKDVYADHIAIGSQHISNDIARGLSTSMEQAERIKVMHGNVVAAPSDDYEYIEVLQLEDGDLTETNQVPRSMVVGIVRPRVEEILEIVRGRLEDSGVNRVAGRRVVITGGGSQLLGMRDLGMRVFNRQVRLGRPHEVEGVAESVSGPGFATALGLLEYARIRAKHAHTSRDGGVSPLRQTFEKALQWVREYL